MRNIFKHILLAGAAVLLSCFASCTDETLVDDGTHSDKGTLLNLTATLETDQVQTRLAELGGSAEELANIINGKTPDGNSDNPDGLKHIGLYIYYADDYVKDNLSNPYIRNLRCNINDGKITPCDKDGKALTGDKDKIYIYDRMIIVAFYPYNEDMSLEKNFFKNEKDEEAYPISRSIYENQTYIPYRAETDVNPTNAYYRKLGFSVKHTAKIEIVLVSNDLKNLPTADFKSGDIKILPKLDPYQGTQNGGDGYTSDTREHWLDGIKTYPEINAPTGGLFTRQYVAYLWTSKVGDKHHDNTNNKYGETGVEGDHNHWDNNIAPNDIIFQSGSITLFSSQQVNLAEQRVYRYGYNMDTGEVFIPTSSQLVNDATSLQDVNCDKTSAYQVCDIDLTGRTWAPKSIADGTYDGGGHKIKGLSITSTATGEMQTGLFGNINGNSYIRNVNLIEPKITVSMADSCFVGALCGYINPRLTEKQKEELGNNLPEGLSEVVKAELLKDLIAEMTNSTSQIISCRVENPTITVTGKNARVGTICGAAGDMDEQGKYFAKIWDSYSLGGEITVNEKKASDNVKALVGGLCGANSGRIIHSYSTTIATAMYEVSGIDKNIAAGLSKKGYYADEFAKLNTKKGKPRFQIEDCYVLLKNDNDDADGVNAFSTSTWPLQATWVTYTGKWPVYSNDWKDPEEEETDSAAGHPSIRSYWKNIGSAPTYPTLLWEREY